MSQHVERRGTYDRGLTRAERSTQQRAAILVAGIAALDEFGSASLTVDHVVSRARVGRNTFYAHFDGILDLVGGVREEVLERTLVEVDAAVAACRTPLEALRAMADAWLSACVAQPAAARAMLSHSVGADPRQLGGAVVPKLAARLLEVGLTARRAGLLRVLPPVGTRLAIAGAFVTVALAAVDRRDPLSLDAAQASLVELTVRAIR